MADYFTQFSCMFDVATAENVTRALAIYEEQTATRDEAESGELGFTLEPAPDCGPGMLWISSDGHGEPEHVIAFALACAEAFDLKGRWGFTWALTCRSRGSTDSAAARSCSTWPSARASPGPTASTG